MINLEGIHHIGVAVKDLEKSIKTYTETLNMKVLVRESLPHFGVNVAFLDATSPTQIELISPINEDSPLWKFLNQRGEGLHHLCYAVTNLKQKLVDLKNKGVKLIDTEPRMGAQGHTVAFAHHSSFEGILTEFIQINS